MMKLRRMNVARQKKLTDAELSKALAEIAAEQAAWFAANEATKPVQKELATLALCQWIAYNCDTLPADRAARR